MHTRKYIASALIFLAFFLLAFPLRAEGTITQLTGDGCWTWFNDPRALYDDGKLYLAWITKDQPGTPKSKVQFASYEFTTGQTAVRDLNPDFQSDDHDNPGIVKGPDGAFTAFYTMHSGSGLPVFYRVIAPGAGNTLTLIGAEQTVPTTPNDVTGTRSYNYANPHRLTNDSGLNRLYLFSRGLNFNPVYRIQQGTNWGATTNLILNAPARPYVKYHSTDDRVCFAFTDAHPSGNSNNIYYACLRAGAYYRANGAKIKNLSDGPLLISDFAGDKVFDRLANPQVTGTNSWIWDVALDSNGNPVVTFATFPSVSAHQYHWARWNGSQWVDRIVVSNAGGSITGSTTSEPYYSGGIVIDHSNPNLVYLCRQTPVGWDLEQWKTADGGNTWSTLTIAAGAGASDENIRPCVPLKRPADTEMVLWLNGTYDYWDFSRGIGYNTAVKLWTNPVLAPTLQFVVTGRSLVLSWSGSFVLQLGTNVSGPYENLATVSPYTNSMPTVSQQFFRLRNY